MVTTELCNEEINQSSLIDSRWHLQLSQIVAIGLIKDEKNYIVTPVSISEYYPWNFNYEISPSTLLGEAYENNKYKLPISIELEKEIFDLIRGLKGFPSYLKQNYLRMLYFSVVTITTLGFGDIVPISTISRIAVTTEAVLGIVLIGLFLNSLANIIKKK